MILGEDGIRATSLCPMPSPEHQLPLDIGATSAFESIMARQGTLSRRCAGTDHGMLEGSKRPPFQVPWLLPLAGMDRTFASTSLMGHMSLLSVNGLGMEDGV